MPPDHSLPVVWTVVGSAPVAAIPVGITASRVVGEAVMLVADVTGGIVASLSSLGDARSRDGADAEERQESARIP
jgi:hypothetical protein